MRHLRIYMQPSGEGALHRSGFSWGAAIAWPLWAVTHRLYKTAVVWCLCLIGFGLLGARRLAGMSNQDQRELDVLVGASVF